MVKKILVTGMLAGIAFANINFPHLAQKNVLQRNLSQVNATPKQNKKELAKRLLKGTFMESVLTDKNLKLKIEKVDENFYKINVTDKTTQKTSIIYEYAPKKYFFVGMMVLKDGKIVNPNIVNKKTVNEAVAFTFGKGKKELYVLTDPECPFCKKMEREKGDILEKNYKVHVILFPLSFHKNAKQMTAYILQGKNEKERYERFKKVLKGETEEWKNAKITSQVEEYLKKSEKAFKELKATGTPSVYNNKFNPINWTQLK